mgnify:CR=1 FL=1
MAWPASLGPLRRRASDAAARFARARDRRAGDRQDRPRRTWILAADVLAGDDPFGFLAIERLIFEQRPGQAMELVEVVGVSPHHLQRTFKRLLGVSPRAYADALRLGVSIEEIYQLTKIDPWFLDQIQEIIAIERRLKEWGTKSPVETSRRDVSTTEKR